MSKSIAKAFLFKPVKTHGDAYNFLNACITWLGGGFHPDTSADDYINIKTNTPTFTATECKKYDKNMDKVFKLLPDPYALCIDVLNTRGMY